MKFAIGIVLVMMLIYLGSFAVHNWKRKNKLAAIGSALLGLAAFGLGLFVVFFGNYEV